MSLNSDGSPTRYVGLRWVSDQIRRYLSFFFCKAFVNSLIVLPLPFPRPSPSPLIIHERLQPRRWEWGETELYKLKGLERNINLII